MRLRNQRGQILPLFVFFFTMIFGIFLISHNVGRMAMRRVQLQVAADAGALAGARSQALGLEFIAAVNDRIELHMAQLLADLLNAVDPLETIEALEDAAEQVEGILACHKYQDDIINLYYLALPVAGAAFLSGTQTDNADWVTGLWPMDEISKPQLGVTQETWTIILGGLNLRSRVVVPLADSTTIEEKSTAIAISMPSSKPGGSFDMVGGGFLGIQMPTMVAWGSAKPYWILGSKFGDVGWKLGKDPRDEEMTPLASIVSMLVPGPLWTARMTETGKIPTSITGYIGSTGTGMAAWVEEKVVDYINDKIKEGLVEKLEEKLGEGEGEGSCFF